MKQMIVYKKTALDTPDDGLMRARNMLRKDKKKGNKYIK
jgi:hypothetical protein